MDVVALSPVLVERLFWRPSAERWALTVLVKATFDVVPGELRMSSQPLGMSPSDVFEGGNPARSLIAPSDLVPFKTRADVMLVGHAYAPHGRPVSALTARLAVGGVDKSIAVLGNRMVSPRGVGPALPFAKMSLSYERAAGGPGTANPPGMPRGDRLPNLEPVRHREGTMPLIGFGPIAPSWPERAAKQRPWRLDDPLPEDFDAGSFNAAPADQQVGFLRGDETLVLEHLHPDHTTLTTRLASLVPRAFVERPRFAPEALELHADTLWIDTDRRKLSIVWRGEAALAAREEPGRVLVAMTNLREPVGFEQMQDLARELASPAREATPTLNDGEEPAEEDADEMRSTNAVHAARLHKLPSFDDDDEGDDANLPSHLDPIGTSTRAFPAMGAAVLPDATPAWLATPSRQAAVLPSRQAAVLPSRQRTADPSHRGMQASQAEVVRSETPTMPPPDLLWDAPADSTEPLTLPPPRGFEAAASAAPSPSSKQPSTRPPPPLEEVRTGPLPMAAAEPASPWASGLDPASPLLAVLPMPVPMPAAVIVRPEPRPDPRPSRGARSMPLRAPADAVDLVWFDAASVARIASRFRELVDALDMEPLDPDHDLPVDDPLAARDRHHVFGVLTRGLPTEARGVPAAVRAATDAHGRFTPPLVVVEGELVFGLDEPSVLKTTAACAKPLAKDSKRLQDVLASIDELLETPLLQGVAGAGDGLLRELLAAVAQSKRALPVKVLEDHVERLLLSQRTYQIRSVLGGPQIRASLAPARDALALISYLPEAVGPKLPLALRFRARLIAEVHPSPDPMEAAPLALRVVALSRLVPLPGRG
jgi:hypothetical protein